MSIEKRFGSVEKAIYTDPVAIELDFVSPYMRGSTLKRLDNECMLINQLSVGWIELFFALMVILLELYSNLDISTRVNEQFERDKKIATTDVFYESINNPDTIGPYRIIVERKPKIEEVEIISRYKELGEAGYREYLKEEYVDGEEIFGRIIMLGIFFTMLVMGFPRCKRFVFDRKSGTVTYPRFLGIGSYKIPFQKVNFIYARAGMYVTERKGLAILHPNGVGRVFINFQYPERFLSFYVWYMDKNRPLPPGTAFDPYRELDYDRRKAADFPSSLYPSLIETPEWIGAGSMEQREEYRKYVERLIAKVKTPVKKMKAPAEKAKWYSWLYSWMYED
ncbi:hypothetical protein [Bacteroides sp.]